MDRLAHRMTAAIPTHDDISNQYTNYQTSYWTWCMKTQVMGAYFVAIDVRDVTIFFHCVRVCIKNKTLCDLGELCELFYTGVTWNGVNDQVCQHSDAI